MKLISARRTISAGAVMAASVIALAAPGSALAKKEACKGTNTAGIGSSLQAEAVAIWIPGFEKNAKYGCEGKPAITSYNPVGSGGGYKAWKEHEEYGTYGFIGTDNTANQSEKEAVEKEDAKGESKLLTIPVLQGAVAVVVNLPAECAAESTIAKGRLALDQSTVERIYKGTITKWNELEAVEGAGNKLTGTGCTSAIIPVVRQDGSGTTHIFKKFLSIQEPKAEFEYESGKSATWGALAEGSLSTKWPLAAKTQHAVGANGKELLKFVAATPGSIGYANLADARNEANGGFTGQSASRFWVELENSSKGTAPKRNVKYADPSSNEDSKTAGESNCKKTVFSNGVGSFPPPTALEAWNEVTATGTSKTYALCGLTYDFALTKLENMKGGTAEEAATVKEYINYVVQKKGGATDIIGHDYSALPKAVATVALAGVAQIG